MDTETPILSPKEGQAFFINQECFQDRALIRGSVFMSDRGLAHGSTGLLPLITLRRRSSTVKAIRCRLMRMEPESRLISLKCSDIDSPSKSHWT